MKLTELPQTRHATRITKSNLSITEFTSFADQKQISEIRYKIYNSYTKIH
jgi:hypothetical protein